MADPTQTPPPADPLAAYLSSGGTIAAPGGSQISQQEMQQRSSDPALAVTGGLTAHEFASFHAQQALADKQHAGARPTIEDFNKDYSDWYGKALDAQTKVQESLSQSGVDLAKKASEDQMDVAKSQEMNQVTQKLPPADIDKAQAMSYVWKQLDGVQNAWQQAWNNRAKSGFGGNAVGGTLGHVGEFASTDVKAFNSQVDGALTSLATGLEGDTAGAGGRPGTQSLMRGMMPNINDDPDSMQAKMNALRTMSANQAQSFLDVRSGKNSQGVPAYDVTPVLGALQPHLDFLNKSNQTQATQAQVNAANTQKSGTIFSPNSLALLQNAANQGTQAKPVPVPSPAAGPTPLPTPAGGNFGSLQTSPGQD